MHPRKDASSFRTSGDRSSAERNLKIRQAFEKWHLTISSRVEEEDFLWLRSEYDELLGSLEINPRFEMEPEDTPVVQVPR